MRRSSTQAIDVAISREIQSDFDSVKLVADNIELIKDLKLAIENGVFDDAGLVIAEPLRSNILAVGDIADKVNIVADNVVSVTTVSNNINSVNDIRAIITQIVALSSIITELIALHAVLGKLTNLSDSLDELQPLLNNLNDVLIVAAHMTEVNSVADNMANVISLNNNEVNVNTVAGSIHYVNVVGSHMETVTYVANHLAGILDLFDRLDAVQVVADNMPNVIEVADNVGSVNIVGNDLSVAGYSNLQDLGSITEPVTVDPGDGVSYIKTVATNIDNVNLVGASITDVNAIVDEIIPNMAEILQADTNAATATAKAAEAVGARDTAVAKAAEAAISQASASTSATNALASESKAHKWADEAEDVPVQGTIGVNDEYSAYHWAKKAEAASGGSILLGNLYDVNTDGATDKQAIVYDAAGSVGNKWIPKTIDKAYVGLSNVDNTSDVNKPISSATQTALDAKVDDTQVSMASVPNTIPVRDANEAIEIEIARFNNGANELRYNAADGTLEFEMNETSVVQSIGMEFYIRVKASSAISDGAVVMATGAVGNSGYMTAAHAIGVTQAQMLLGVATEPIAAGAFGYITKTGLVRGINTSAWAEGTKLYYNSAVAGGLTSTIPTTGVCVALAMVVSSGTNGSIYVRASDVDENFIPDRIDCGTIV